MTLEELQAAAARVPELERRIAQLEASNQRPELEPLGFTLEQVSEKILPGVPVATLRDWIRNGELVAHLTPGGRVYLVYMEDLRALLARLKSKKPDAAERLASIDGNVQRILAKHPKKAS